MPQTDHSVETEIATGQFAAKIDSLGASIATFKMGIDDLQETVSVPLKRKQNFIPDNSLSGSDISDTSKDNHNSTSQINQSSLVPESILELDEDSSLQEEGRDEKIPIEYPSFLKATFISLMETYLFDVLTCFQKSAANSTIQSVTLDFKNKTGFITSTPLCDEASSGRSTPNPKPRDRYKKLATEEEQKGIQLFKSI